MPVFTYNARSSSGQHQRGTQEAPSASIVAGQLRQRGWLVLDVREADASSKSLGLAQLNPLAWLPPRSIDVEVGLQQLAVMLRSGLTLLASLKTLAEYAGRRSLRRAWEVTSERIQQGSNLADAMAEHRCFNRLTIQLIRVGELTGTLETVMARAAEAMERRRLLRTQVLTALTYPTIVLIAALGVSTFMVLGVIPKLRVFLETMGRRLPPMTQFLLDLSAWVQTNGLYVLIALLTLTVVFIAIYLWPSGRLIVDRWVLRLPILGNLLRLAGTVQFAHSLEVLLASGITLVEGLRTTKDLLNNRYLAECTEAARNAILGGGSLAEPLAVPQAFMPMLGRMVAVGESAGTLEEVLGEVKTFHELQLQNTIRRFSVLIEPVIIVLVGGIVGYVYIAFFVAMFSVAGSGGR